MKSKPSQEKHVQPRKTEADPKWGKPSAWWSSPVHLEEEDAAALSRLLAINEDEKIAQLTESVARALGQYSGGAREAMSPPSPAGKLLAVKEIGELTGALLDRLETLPQETRLDLTSATRLYRVPHFFSDLRKALEKLQVASWAAGREIEDHDKDSRGGGLRDRARDHVAFVLTDIFRHFDKDAAARGASKRRAIFVVTALEAGKVPSPNWKEMQRKLACIPLQSGG